MAQLNLLYGDGTLSVNIPDTYLGEVVSPRPVAAAPDPEAVIQAALAQPIGSSLLEHLVHPGQTVAVIVDDITRETPTQLMLPPVLDRLLATGIPQTDIRVVIALGTHRPMTEAEIIAKTGSTIAREFEVVNISCWDDDQMMYMGTSSNGIPAWVNRTVATADVRVGLGMITPHMDAGYSGGAKIILPGVCSGKTVDAFHAREADILTNQLGDIESPMRRDLEQFVGERVGLDFIVNAILTGEEEIYRCVAGHFIQAHRAGVQFAREVYGVPVARRYPLVISNAFPAQIDLWQSTKGIWCGELMTSDGGTLILVTHCQEGANNTHPLFVDYAGRDPDQLKRELDTGHVEDPNSCALAIHVGRMKRRIKLGLVSSGLSRAEAARMGFVYYNTVEAALAAELDDRDGNAAVGMLTHAGVTLPLVQ
jgi:nickel-dependent lactate racemase